MNELAWELRYFDVEQALTLSQTTYDLAGQGEGYAKGLVYSRGNLSFLNSIVFKPMKWANFYSRFQ